MSALMWLGFLLAAVAFCHSNNNASGVSDSGSSVPSIVVTISTTPESKSLVLDYGETITLTCTAIGASNLNITWKQGEVNTELKTCSMRQPCELAVESATVSGDVSCIAEYDGEFFNDTVTVRVRSNATVKPRTAQLNSMTAINLTCSVAGYPLPNVSWILPDDTIVRGAGKKSKLTVLGADGGGIYRCRAESSLSNSTANATVQVEGFIFSVSVNNSWLNSTRPSAALNCTAKGFPPPSLEWVRMKATTCTGEVAANSNTSCPVSGNRTSISHCSAVVTRGGTYVCRIFLKDSFSSTVNISSKHRNNNCITINGVWIVAKNKRSILNCFTEGLPRTRVEWVGKRDIGGDFTVIETCQWPNVTVCRLESMMSGIYYCRTSGNRTKKITVKSSPVIRSTISQFQVKGCNEAFVRLNCTAWGYPIANIQWYRNLSLNGNSSSWESFGENAQIIVKRNESGMYKCTAMNKLGFDDFTVSVAPGRLCIDIVSSNLTIDANESAILLCVVSGSAENAFSVNWTHGSTAKEIVPTSTEEVIYGNLKTVNTTLAVEGRLGGGPYNCVAENNEARIVVRVRPRIHRVFQSSTLNCTGSVMLRCIAVGYPNVAVWWQLDDGLKLAGESNFTNDTTTVNDLLIERETAQRSYTCVAENDVGHRSETVTIQAIGCVVSVSKSVSISADKAITLNCSAMSFSAESVRWKRVDPPGSRAVDENVTRDRAKNGTQWFDASLQVQGRDGGGVYTCFVEGGTSMNTTVYVESEVLAHSNKANLAYNEEVNLFCTGAGYPLPNVFWLSPNNSIIPRHLYTSPSEMTSEASVTFNLRTGGIYTCQGNNSIPETRISKSTVNLHIHPQVLRLTPNDDTVTIGDGQSVNVSCHVAGYPKPNIVWSVRPDVDALNEAFVENSSSTFSKTLILRNISFDQNGTKYTCTASRGERSHLKMVIVIVEADVNISKPPQNVAVKVGDNASFECKAEGKTALTIAWFKESSTEKLKDSLSRVLKDENGIQSLLTLTSVDLQHGGRYYCMAGTKISFDLAKSATATLGVVSFIAFTAPIIRLPVNSFSLRCLFKANPEPRAGFRFEGKVIEKPVEEEDGTWSVSRSFTPVNASLGGNYTCTIKFSTSWLNLETIVVRVAARIMKWSQSATVLKQNNARNFKACCEAIGYPIPRITWTRSVADTTGKLGLLEEDIVSSPSDRTNRSCLQAPPTASRWKLIGQYECFCFNDVDDSDNATMEFRAAPKFVSTPTENNLKWYERGAINCSARGYPIPEISWKFRNNYVSSSSTFQLANRVNISTVTRFSSLGFKSSQAPQHGGVYECTATNSVNSMRKTLLGKFFSKILSRPSRLSVSFGETISLGCNVSGYPLADAVKWYKNMEKVERGEATLIHSHGNTVISSELKIFNATANDTGNYTCHRLDGKSAQVLVGAEFLSTPPRLVTRPVNEFVNFICSAEGSPPLILGWQFSSDGSETRYVLMETGNVTEPTASVVTGNLSIRITEKLAGYYRCWVIDARNVWLASPSSYLNVTYKPKSLFSSREQICIKEKKCLLNCSFDANPQASISWLWENGTKVRTSDEFIKFRFGGNSSTLTLVRPGFNIDGIEIRCEANNSIGKNKSSIRLFVKGPPSPVVVKDTFVSATEASLVWKPPFDGNSRIVYYTVKSDMIDGPCCHEVVNVNVSSRSLTQTYTLTDLKPFRTYTITVVAVNAYGSSPIEDHLDITTDASKPSRVRNITATVVSSRSMLVEWRVPSEPNGRLDFYRVYFGQTMTAGRSSRSENQVTVSGTNTSTMLKALRPYTRYAIYVTAVNINSRNETLESAFNNPITTNRTFEDAPSTPRNVSVNLVSDQESQLVVAWIQPTYPNGVIKSYDVLYHLASSSNLFDIATVDGQSNETFLDGLAAYTNYTVRVRANTTMLGNYSEAVTGRTDEGRPSAPRDVLANPKQRSMSLNWEEPIHRRGKITEYLVVYNGSKLYRSNWTTKKFFSSDRVLVKGNVRKIILSDLQPDANYIIVVSASTSKGHGNRSEPYFSKTAISEPICPPSPSGIEERFLTNIFINLTQPSDLNGKISSIQLLVLEVVNSFSNSEAQTEAQKAFMAKEVGNFTSRPASESPPLPYVAAQFEFEFFPNSFIIGDGELHGGYWNVPLQPGRRYAVAVKSLSENEQDNHYSNISEIRIFGTQRVEQLSGDKPAITAAAVVVVLIILAVVVLLVVFYLRKRKVKPEKESAWIEDNHNRDDTNELVPMTDISFPTVSAEDTEILGLEGDTAVLLVVVGGEPKPSVSWWKSGKELKEDSRIRILGDGSLQVADTCKSDAGLFKCIVENRSGTESISILLKVQSGDEVCEKVAVPADDFEKYVEDMSSNDEEAFLEEFRFLQKIEPPILSAEPVARLDCNRGKNRYGNIIPYDHCRVVLNELPDQTGSDYINATYLKGFSGPDQYIATQGPNEKTAGDFWRMIWEKNVPTIVMVTNVEEGGVAKCYKYWPGSEGQQQQQQIFGKVIVKALSETVIRSCTVRAFSIFTEEERSRTVTQFHFTGWPDHGVPSNPSSLLTFAKQVRRHHDQQKKKDLGPMVVHCSAGVGRTGTFIVVDYAIQESTATKSVDVFNIVAEMRRCRSLMVQTGVQYIFCHTAILEHLLCGNASVPAERLKFFLKSLKTANPETKTTGYENHMKLLEKLSPSREDFTYSVGLNYKNVSKNRYSKICPPDFSRLYLLSDDAEESSTYVNAYYLDGYRQSDFYIAAQCPLESTLSDFWSLIWEQNCTIIVMMTQLEEDGKEMSVKYWPTEGSMEMENFTVTFLSEEPCTGYILRNFKLTTADNQQERTVMQIQCLDWSRKACPNSAASVIGIFEELGRVQRQETFDLSRIVVACNDGVGRSATFCAIHWMLEVLKTEQIIDIFQVIKAMRRNNPDVVTSLEHYRFCYTVAAEFLDSFSTYANFK